MKNIKYVFLGNSQNLKEIGEYPNKVSESWTQEARTIFQTYCKSPMNTKYEQRNKVVGHDGNYYFTITPTNIFYLILADSSYQERHIFQLVEEMQKESIYLLVDEKGELNKIGKQSLKNLIEGYQNPESKLTKVRSDIEDIQIEMKNNVKHMVNQLEDAQGLKVKSEMIKNNSVEFSKKANELKRVTCWQNCKWTIILLTLIIGILLIIILPIVLSKNSANVNTNGGTSANSTNSTNTTLLR